MPSITAPIRSKATPTARCPSSCAALNAYDDAARDVAKAIRAHAGTDEFNQRVNQLNDTKTEAVKRCRASL